MSRIEVELLFAKNVAAWIKDKLWHSSQEMVPDEGWTAANDAQGGGHG
jgi:hypothetical protein